MTENTNTTNGNGSNTTITRPCGIWTMVNAMVANGWGYAREIDKTGKTTRQPRKFTCPVCKDKLAKLGKKGVLLVRASKNVVVFSKEGRPAVALCHGCNYKKKEGKDAAPPSEDIAASPPLPPAQNTPRLCKCGQPLPPNRKAKCFFCIPPKKNVVAGPTVGDGQY